MHASDKTAALLSALGLSDQNAYTSEGTTYYFTSDVLNTAVRNVMSDSTAAKNTLERYVKANGGTTLVETDANGRTTATGLPLGLYLIVETYVPENVTCTVNPFFVSVPMTTVDGAEWMYDITLYPKNETGNPTGFVPDADGKIVIRGLEDDVYYLKETATDAGYQLLAEEIKVEIAAAESTTGCTVCGKALLTAIAKVSDKAVTMLAAVAYPFVSNYFSELRQSKVVTDYDTAVAALEDADGAAALEAARAYNAALANGQAEGLCDYEALLNPTGNGMMGVVTIPAIDVELPIYHGTQSLELGALHLQGTSLPVGGASTHCVISAHSGMSSEIMFTDGTRAARIPTPSSALIVAGAVRISCAMSRMSNAATR